MKKLTFISVLVVVIGICFTVSAVADFYVIPVQKKIDIVPKTGETTCYSGESPWGEISCTGTGQDGEHQMGITPVVEPSGSTPYTLQQRFTDNSDGTVTDNLTGLIWLKNAGCFGGSFGTNWANALSDCNSLASGSCGLTDGSTAGDWRLPNFNELRSLVDTCQSDPALPSDHPFTNVDSGFHWSSTTYESDTGKAWYVVMFNGNVNGTSKDNPAFVWPVRSDN